MHKLIIELFWILTPQQRRRLYLIQLLVVLMAFVEVLGISSIAPFMAILGNMSLVEGPTIIGDIYRATGMTDPRQFLFFSGVFVLVSLTISAIVSTYTVWQLSLLGVKIGTELSDRLYRYYMSQHWLFHASGSSAQFIKQISVESLRISDYVILPLLNINARAVLVLFISVGLFIYNPIVALSGLTLFIGGYLLVYRVVKRHLQRAGAELSTLSTQRFRLMQEGFGGIKNILMSGHQDTFIQRFQDSGVRFAHARGSMGVLGQIPRYFMELIAFGAMITLILVLIMMSNGDLGTVLPIFSIYAFAGLKLLPSLQQIYVGVSHVRGNIAGFEEIRLDLQASSQQSNSLQSDIIPSTGLVFQDRIKLENISFTYPERSEPTLNTLSLEIFANQTVGVVGPSGGGKSTTIDVLLGLIQPQSGALFVDGHLVTDATLRAWQSQIGLVPQSIFLTQGSIAENVAFGIPASDIRLDQVNRAIELAHLSDFVSQLPDGLNTAVGERGIQLSGGQRQRIGIARALYHDPPILVFDEATSSLDGITETYIMNAIHDLGGKKTIIIIAHRLKTVEKCDVLFYLDQGQVIAQGSYQHLIDTNPHFERMVKHV